MKKHIHEILGGTSTRVDGGLNYVTTIRHEGCEFVTYTKGGIVHKPLCDNHEDEDEFAPGIQQTSQARR